MSLKRPTYHNPARNRPDRKGAVTTWRKTASVGATNSRRKPAPKEKTPRKIGSSSADSAASHWKHLWLLHRQVGKDALARMLVTPVASLMTILVLGIALSLPAALSMTLDNLRTVAGSGDMTSVKVSLYLGNRIDDAAAVRIREELARDKAIAKAVYISPAQGLAEFEKYSGLGAALQLLDGNPLPGVIEVEPADTSPLAVSNLQNRLVRMTGIEEVRVDSEWLKRLNAILSLGDRVMTGLTGLICIAVLLAVGNTIRLLVVNRQEEIRVIKLVGGSDGFVILPFLYSGFWYGLAGGVLAWLVVFVGWLTISGPAGQLATLYQSTFRLDAPGLGLTTVLIGGGAAMGVIGALLASWRQLIDIDP